MRYISCSISCYITPGPGPGAVEAAAARRAGPGQARHTDSAAAPQERQGAAGAAPPGRQPPGAARWRARARPGRTAGCQPPPRLRLRRRARRRRAAAPGTDSDSTHWQIRELKFKQQLSGYYKVAFCLAGKQVEHAAKLEGRGEVYDRLHKRFLGQNETVLKRAY